MAEVFGLNVDGIRDLREIKRRVLNRPLNAGPKRARWPVGTPAEGTKLFRVEGNGAEAFYRGSHPDGAAAVEIRATGDEGDQYDLFFDYIRGVYVPGDYVTGYRHNGNWQAYDGGRHFWGLAYTTGDSVDGVVDVDLFETSGIVVQAITTYDLLSDTFVEVNFDAGSDESLFSQAAGFFVTGVACPNPSFGTGSGSGS